MKRRRGAILVSATVGVSLAATAVVAGLQTASAHNRDHHGQRPRPTPATAATFSAAAAPSGTASAAPTTPANTIATTTAAAATTTKVPTSAPITTPVADVLAECGTGSFQAEVVKKGAIWTVKNGSRTVYTGKDMRTAVQSGIDSLTPKRTTKERVVVRGSGVIPANERVKLASYTTLDVCGTISSTGPWASDHAPIFGRGVNDVEVQHLDVVGRPMYGIFMRQVTNLKLGEITMDLKDGGIGVRVDNNHSKVHTKGLSIGTLTVENATSHALETAGIDGVTVGSVAARNVGESAVLLGTTINATIGLIDAQNVGAGTGYAAFRMANQNGLVNGKYPTNVKVGSIKARGGGRGIFCVSESGGATIGKVDIEDTGNNAILIENCHNVNIATEGGTITGGGEIRIAARTQFANNTDIRLGNFTLSDSKLVESPCVDDGLELTGIKLKNATVNRC